MRSSLVLATDKALPRRRRERRGRKRLHESDPNVEGMLKVEPSNATRSLAAACSLVAAHACRFT